jgi:hypothetical protein
VLGVFLSACAAPRLITLPSDQGTPFPDFASVHAQISSACAGVRTLRGELGLSGNVGNERLRGTVVAGFERPYGWAWLLMLAAELHRGGEPSLKWSQALSPLATAFAERFRDFLPKATYPIRSGAHLNTAFAVALAIDYADTVEATALALQLREKALQWYSNDRDAQAWEPSGDDFLSPTLVEAECMRSVISPISMRCQSWVTDSLPTAAAASSSVAWPHPSTPM